MIDLKQDQLDDTATSARFSNQIQAIMVSAHSAIQVVKKEESQLRRKRSHTIQRIIGGIDEGAMEEGCRRKDHERTKDMVDSRLGQAVMIVVPWDIGPHQPGHQSGNQGRMSGEVEWQWRG